MRRLPVLEGYARSGRVVFLSHCLLNENVRYPGGAFDACCVRDVVAACMRAGIGMVQLPCPEQEAWGGVTKPWMFCGHALAGPLRRAEPAAVALLLRRTRHVFRRLAKSVAATIEDYLASAYSVVGVVGVDGSPSCGVTVTMDAAATAHELSTRERPEWTAARMNALVRRHSLPGAGMFVAELRAELERRRLPVPFVAHDLLAELDGREPGLVARWLARASERPRPRLARGLLQRGACGPPGSKPP